MATVTERYENLVRLVKKLSRNLDSVPEKDQEGRYRKAFQTLKGDICREAEAVFPYLVVSGFRILPEDKEAFLDGAGSVIAKAKESGYPARLGSALVVSCDMDLFLAYTQLLQCDLMEQFYAGYWSRHTMDVEGRYYNDLIHMWYDMESGLWRNDKDLSFGIYFPPEKEAFLEQIQENRESLRSQIADRASVLSQSA